MQEDKNLKELLMKWAVENPSPDFTSGVMHRVTSVYAFNQYVQPLFKQKLPRVLLSLFILVCIALFALSFTIPFTALPFQFTIKLPARYYSQLFYFLIAFWVVMLLNQVLKKLPFNI